MHILSSILQNFIQEHYHEDPDQYDHAISDFMDLREVGLCLLQYFFFNYRHWQRLYLPFLASAAYPFQTSVVFYIFMLIYYINVE